jgi:apolipoprotein N-acyltransferase
VNASAVNLKPNWQGHLVALFAGLLLPLAFSPFDYYPIALVSLTLLFLSWQHVNARTAALRGFLFGLGLFGVGVSWIYVAIHVFGQASVLLAGALTAIFVAFLSLYTAGLGWIVKRATQGVTFSGADFVLLLPVAWLGFEWFKAWFLTGFPWLEVGVSQIPGPLSGYTPVVGALGVSLIMAFSAGLLAYFWESKKLSAVFILVLIWAGGFALKSVEWTSEKDLPLTVTIVQGNVPQDIKWNKEQVIKTLALYQAETERHWSSDLVVWPENAVTAFYHQVKDFYLDPLAEAARENKTDILLGLPIYEAEAGRYYNGMVSLGSELGIGFYHKRHLVPFGDYVPFEWLRGLIAFFDLPMSSFAIGADGQALLAAAGQKVGISICYEDTFSNEVLETVPEASLLVNATNNAWYGDSFAPHQHLQISQNRALETGRPIIRATTNGISALIDHRGALQATTAQFEQVVLTGEVQPRQDATFYVQWQRWPLLGLALFMLLVWAYYRQDNSKTQTH